MLHAYACSGPAFLVEGHSRHRWAPVLAVRPPHDREAHHGPFRAAKNSGHSGRTGSGRGGSAAAPGRYRNEPSGSLLAPCYIWRRGVGEASSRHGHTAASFAWRKFSCPCEPASLTRNAAGLPSPLPAIAHRGYSPTRGLTRQISYEDRPVPGVAITDRSEMHPQQWDVCRVPGNCASPAIYRHPTSSGVDISLPELTLRTINLETSDPADARRD